MRKKQSWPVYCQTICLKELRDVTKISIRLPNLQLRHKILRFMYEAVSLSIAIFCKNTAATN